jgi:uncharacterized phage protein gp47/JayE
MLTLGQLREPMTEDEFLDYWLAQLASLGFQTTNWEEDSVQLLMFRAGARVWADLSSVMADKARAPYPSLARGDYQDLLGQYTYKLTRTPAIATQGEMLLTSSAAAPIHTWNDGEIIIADAAEAPANTWRIDTGDTLNPGATLTVEVTAETPGSAGNITPNTTLYLWTPMVGVTVTNPARSGSSTWITTNGQEEEDSARYADRMMSRYDRIAMGTDGAYRAWALEAVPEITDAIVKEGATAMSVRIIGRTESGGLTAGQISDIEDYLNGVTDGIQRRMVNDVLYVESATVVTTPALNLTVTCTTALSSDVSSRVTASLLDFLAELPIGGEVIAPAAVGKVYASRIYSAVMSQAGVKNVSGVPSDITLQPTDIYQPTINITVLTT